ncbi:J domain-containing protein [Amnibacterium setariae]|uniref:Molecular chaperone DnaJ n=1 Tax=Amnibacterium setariae TaxID=2306585 RepID=A0A3A1TW01_9MICO|nr:DnaJ domain-containing protein [Amnibacterium setariae]RIX27721.1 molecular chaperone DnaJ [Amnibacterium setariae]
MTDSPMSASPYEVLGVPASASDEDLRRAYRRLLRETHPDTGGDPQRFIAVQAAWERIGSPDARAQYDRGRSPVGEPASWAPSGPSRAERPASTRPGARTYGHPGGWRRERYLTLLREWVGLGETIPDPYDPVLVRRAPREIRHLLADALAEEETARRLATLGIGYTVWHDVAAGGPDEKIDHVVLGPTGLFAIQSEDFGAPLGIRRGELVGEALAGERPMHELAVRAKAVARSARVKFTGLLLVLPDEHLPTPAESLGSSRGAEQVVLRASVLLTALRDGLPDARPVGGNEIFEVRTRLQAAVRFA